MSLNNVRQYALMLMLLCGAAGLSGMAQADDGACEMMSAVKKSITGATVKRICGKRPLNILAKCTTVMLL